jgi:hypothetical protein
MNMSVNNETHRDEIETVVNEDEKIDECLSDATLTKDKASNQIDSSEIDEDRSLDILNQNLNGYQIKNNFEFNKTIDKKDGIIDNDFEHDNKLEID